MIQNTKVYRITLVTANPKLYSPQKIFLTQPVSGLGRPVNHDLNTQRGETLVSRTPNTVPFFRQWSTEIGLVSTRIIYTLS
jgi:hypothetical protein